MAYYITGHGSTNFVIIQKYSVYFALSNHVLPHISINNPFMELQKTGEIFSLKKCFSKDFSKFDQESESTFITLQRVVLGVRLWHDLILL